MLDDAREGMDPDIRPQDDLFGHVNGRWLVDTEIPSDKSSWGPFVELAEQSEAQSRAVASATRATTLSTSRYRNGLVSQLDLLDAQRSELANRRQALQVRSAQYQATVGLVRALGGGWEATKG